MTWYILVLGISVPSKVRNLRKMRNFGQNFSIFTHSYSKLVESAEVFLCQMKYHTIENFYFKHRNFCVKQKLFQTSNYTL